MSRWFSVEAHAAARESAATVATAVVVVVLLALEVDGVDDGVGALRGFDGVCDALL